LQWFLWLVAPLVIADVGLLSIGGGVACGLLILVWWLLFSRAPWPDRVGTLALIIGAVYATSRIVHPSIANGMMGMMPYLYAVPAMCLALVAGAAVGRRASDGVRRASLALAILLACGALAAIRTEGVMGAGSQITWRWTPTHEERLLANAHDEPAPMPPPIPSPVPKAANVAAPAPEGQPSGADEAPPRSAAPPEVETDAAAEWPGFRGPGRDDVVRGVRIATDWSRTPPVQLWRRAIGPGWSSFAVRGDLIFTQEQRGDDEIVAAYRLKTGEPVWRHRDPVRFWESNGGAGPRGTPMLDRDRVYAFGATGLLNALDARTGSVVWSRNVSADTKIDVPGWGFASSPVVVDDVVIVAADATLVGYDRKAGNQRWVGPVQHGSYSSPHRTTIGGVEQILLLGGTGVTSVAPASGELLWEHHWPGLAIVQPAITETGDVVVNTIAATGGNGTRRLAVAHGPDGWSVEERWTSTGLKPYFNDFVLDKGYAFGFDGAILACIRLEDGQRLWKGGRYGNGQLVLLADQDLLLVTTEEGEVALVEAAPGGLKELGRFRALEGKTWNHPVVVGDILLLRNGEEMAAFRLPAVQQ
jgi:outer membrane protein assembly factor BamB